MLLKVASWNIFGGKDLPGVIKCLKAIDADIVGLQEVLESEDGSENNARTVADVLGYEWIYEPAKLLTPSQSYVLQELGIGENRQWGNAVLSKFPIKEKRVHALSEVRKRIALEAVVDVGGEDLHFFSTHLVHSLDAAEIRTEQAAALLALVPERRAIVVGDFNAKPETEAIQNMSRVLVQTESDLTRFTRGMHPEVYVTLDPDGKKKRIDYIFITRDLRAVSSDVVDSDASDHLPISATLELP